MDLEQFEHLSLVAKIVTELDNHLGINDKDAAEVIISLARANPTYDKLKKALVENGLDEVSLFLGTSN